MVVLFFDSCFVGTCLAFVATTIVYLLRDNAMHTSFLFILYCCARVYLYLRMAAVILISCAQNICMQLYVPNCRIKINTLELYSLFTFAVLILILLFISCIQLFVEQNKVFVSLLWLSFRKKLHDHVTPLLKELRWLPFSERIVFKLATLSFHYFNGTLPPYLSCCLSSYWSSRALLLSSQKLLTIPRVNLRSAGARSFNAMLHSFGIHYLRKSASARLCRLLISN